MLDATRVNDVIATATCVAIARNGFDQHPQQQRGGAGVQVAPHLSDDLGAFLFLLPPRRLCFHQRLFVCLFVC